MAVTAADQHPRGGGDTDCHLAFRRGLGLKFQPSTNQRGESMAYAAPAPHSTPITELTTPEEQAKVTSSARNLTKGQMLSLATAAHSGKTLSDVEIADLSSIRAAFQERWEVIGVSLAAADTSCCCCC